ncbi:acetamidase/formamidase family protein [Dokdonella sp.]|uniref:acetamidase/formamidase family protein n=1 Tax=Dokdonella sp. TaxID=2291710 RepID=UPI002F403871
MRIVSFVFLFVLLQPPATAGEALRGRWLVTTDLWGNPSHALLELHHDGHAWTGTFDGDPLTAERRGAMLHVRVHAADGHTYAYDGEGSGDTLRGSAEWPDSNHPGRRVRHAFVARRIAERPPGPPRTWTFEPGTFSNEFSPHRPPVLTIWPGDAVRTRTVDSGGVDAHDVTRALFGNPQTGPFYVDGAEPGDTLVVRIVRLRPDRDFADSLDAIVGRALGASLAADARSLGKPVRWAIDRERGVARPQQPSERLRHFEVPLRPMLGGLAVAPPFGSAPVSTGDAGRFGGNMDFNEVAEGATVYLPVYQPGALLYLGDAHARQGDGETSQYALETSMDVEFAVDVVHGGAPSSPRVESASQLMVLGQAGSLDEAVRAATTGLIDWLRQDYGLDLSESAQVLGSAVEYRIANLAGRSVGVAAKLDKSLLAGLARVAR